MSYDSMPDYSEKAPSFEDVVRYATENDLYGKVSITKFYEYYGDFRGAGGIIIDWKKKLHEWASRQRTAVTVTAKEYAAHEKISRAAKPTGKTVDDIWAAVNAI